MWRSKRESLKNNCRTRSYSSLKLGVDSLLLLMVDPYQSLNGYAYGQGQNGTVFENNYFSSMSQLNNLWKMFPDLTALEKSFPGSRSIIIIQSRTGKLHTCNGRHGQERSHIDLGQGHKIYFCCFTLLR